MKKLFTVLEVLKHFFCWAWGISPQEKLNVCGVFWGSVFLPTAVARWRPFRLTLLVAFVLLFALVALGFFLSEGEVWNGVSYGITASAFLTALFLDLEMGFRCEGRVRLLDAIETALERRLGYRRADMVIKGCMVVFLLLASPAILIVSLMAGLGWLAERCAKNQNAQKGKPFLILLMLRRYAMTIKASTCRPIG